MWYSFGMETPAGQPNSSPNVTTSSSRSKTIAVSLFLGATVAMLGCYNLEKYIFPTSSLADNSEVEINSHFPYQILTTPVYANKELGFSISLPQSWTSYAIREDHSGLITAITIGLPLKYASSSSFLSYPESAAQVIDIARFQITPAFAWRSEKGSCDGANGPCFENDVIASSTEYVFSTLYPRPHAGWGFVDEYGDSESYVRSVWEDLDLDGSLRVFEPIAK